MAQSEPTYFKPGDGADAYRLVVRNDGSLPTSEHSTVTITDTLPAGVTAVKVSARGEGPNGGASGYKPTCPEAPIPEPVTCTYSEAAEEGAVLPGATIVMTITVSVASSVTSLQANSASVSGGGAPSADTSETTPVSQEVVPFGLSFFDVGVVNESGEADTQAGSHPYELTATLGFNISGRELPSAANGQAESPLANAAPRDLEVTLPPGLVGDPTAVPRCSQQAFLERERLDCPLDTQVGTVKPFFYGLSHSGVFPLYDVVPPPGQPAELGFATAATGHIPIFLDVRGDRGYALAASLNEIPESGPLQGAILTLWGVPASASHDLEREGTQGEGRTESEACKPSVKVEGGVEKQERCPSGAPAKAFLTLPSGCQGTPLAVGVEDDSWEHPGLEPFPHEADAANGITGCELLSFSPSLAVTPETTQAGAPSGYTIDVRVPQAEDPSALATPALSRAVVRLPAGVVLSPSAAAGLGDCSAQAFEPPPSVPGAPPPAAACPLDARLGTVEIATPLLSSPLEGDVFLGEPECAPCTPAQAQEGKLLPLLVQAQGAGVTVRLRGAVSIDQGTGQLTATFAQVPELPLEDVQLTFAGGPNAPLANPPNACGVALAATAQLTPYSSETPAESVSAPFLLSGCSPATFAPSFVAGTSLNGAGAFSPLTVALSRPEQDEDLQALSVHLPAGLLAMLAQVTPCGEAQASAGACTAPSEIGSVAIAAGPGAHPLLLNGDVYLTGPYEGAPFGLSIVVPAVAGPLDLGTIDMRARIEVNPSTAALTIASDPLPQAIDGIPLQVDALEWNIDRPGFVFNPTSCSPLALAGTATSVQGATALASSRFQAANCATLPFRPKLTALTHALASTAGGVDLHVRVVSGAGGANIAKLKLDLPKGIVPRLGTLQQACTAGAFAADPASCPSASVVGSATVLTPILRQPLHGPVYVVSRGRTAMPEIALVLESEGVVIEIVGEASVTGAFVSSTFPSLPDVPIKELDLHLDAGPHSLLAANLPARDRGNMCGQRLQMPTAITGHNGAVIKQTTIIAVSGCPTRTRARRHRSTGARSHG